MSYFYPGHQGGNTNFQMQQPQGSSYQMQQQPNYDQQQQPSLQQSSSAFYGAGSQSNFQMNTGHYHHHQQQYQQQQQPSLLQQQSSSSFFYPGANQGDLLGGYGGNTNYNQQTTTANGNDDNNNDFGGAGYNASNNASAADFGTASLAQQSKSGSYFYNDNQLSHQGQTNTSQARAHNTMNFIFGSGGAQNNTNELPPLPSGASTSSSSQQQQHQSIPGQLLGAPGDGDIIEIVPAFDPSKRVQAVVQSSNNSSHIDGTRPVYLSVGPKTSDYTQRFRVHYAIDGFIGSCIFEPLTAPTRAIAIAQTTHLILGDKNDKSGVVSFWIRPAIGPGVAPGNFVIPSAAADGQNISVTSGAEEGDLQLSLSPASTQRGVPPNEFQRFIFIKSDAKINSGADVANMSNHLTHQGSSSAYIFTAGQQQHNPPPSSSSNSNYPNPQLLQGVVPSNSNSTTTTNHASSSGSNIGIPAHLMDESTGVRGPLDGPKNKPQYNGPDPTQNGFSRPPGTISFDAAAGGSSAPRPPPGPQQIQGKIYQGSAAVSLANTNNPPLATKKPEPPKEKVVYKYIEKQVYVQPPSLPANNNGNDDDGQDCVVCLTSKKTHLFAPCGHLAVCGDCAKQFKRGGKCPICRGRFESVIKVYQ